MNRDVKLLAEACASHESPGVRAAAKRILAPKRRPSLPRHSAVAKAEARRQQKKESRRKRVAAIREAVFARAFNLHVGGPRCEAWRLEDDRRCLGRAEILDHWHGGSGKRRSMEAVETCWALCRACNDARTANFPDAAWWNETFRLHCEGHGYRFTPHYDARAASRSGAEGDGR